MFYTATLLKQEAIAGNKVRATYCIEDTCFVDNITLDCTLLAYTESIEPAVVLTAYVQRKRNVARNLALYYVGMQDAPSYMVADKNFIDREFSSFNYGKNMYRLVELYYKDMMQLIKNYSQSEEALIQTIKEKLKIKSKVN